MPQGHQLTGTGDKRADPVNQSLQVGDPTQHGNDVVARQCFINKPANGVLPSDESGYLEKRLPQPFPEQPTAHRRTGKVEYRQQGTLGAAGTGVPEQFQIPLGLRVQRHEVAGGICRKPGNLRQDALLCFLDVVNNRPGGLDRQRQVGATKTFQRYCSKMVEERLPSSFLFEVVTLNPGDILGQTQACQIGVF